MYQFWNGFRFATLIEATSPQSLHKVTINGEEENILSMGLILAFPSSFPFVKELPPQDLQINFWFSIIITPENSLY